MPVEAETTIDQKIIGRLDSNITSKRPRRYSSLLCPICKVRFEIGDKVFRVNTAKYLHIKCYPLFRYDSKEKITDKELSNFFNPDIPSKKIYDSLFLLLHR